MADTTQLDATTLEATQNLITRLGDQVDQLKGEQKEVRDMIKGVFDNDEDLQKAETTATAAKQAIKSRQQDINQSQTIIELKLKLADLSEDMKLVSESLNTHLLNYYQMTGTMVIDLPGGGEREFSLKATLKPKKRQ